MIFSEGISKVRAYAIAGGVNGDGDANQLAGAAVVKWQSIYDDKLHQVYVNGKFAGVTAGCAQREIIAALPMSVKAAVKIEVFAVNRENANIDYSETINTKVQSARIKIEFAKTNRLPIDGNASIYFQGEKLNQESIKIYNEFRKGFGLNGFGRSDFGFEGSGAIGLGRGNFGVGEFGFDADKFTWRSGQLETGTYKFDVSISDGRGNQSELSETDIMTVTAPARPAERVKLEMFDKQKGQLTLKVF